MHRLALVSLLVVGVVGCGKEALRAPIIEPDKAELDAVRAFLKTHTQSGEWEEVQWKPAGSTEAFKAGQIAKWQAERKANDELMDGYERDGRADDSARVRADNADLDRVIEQAKAMPANRAIRLTIRTANTLGAKVLESHVYLIRDGKAELADHLAEYFPE